MIIELLVLVICLAVSTILTRYLISHANACQLLDVPNERSSHSTPTPTGGGMAFVVTFICFLLTAGLVFNLAAGELYTLALTGAILAIVGLYRRSSPYSSRMAAVDSFFGGIGFVVIAESVAYIICFWLAVAKWMAAFWRMSSCIGLAVKSI